MLVRSKKYELDKIEAKSMVRWSDFVMVDSGGDDADDGVQITIGGTSPDDPCDTATVTFTRREWNAISRTLSIL